MRRNSFRKKLTGLLWVLLICGTQAQAQDLTKLATDLSTKIHNAKRSRVTVVDFQDLDKKTTKLGKLLAFKLQAALTEPQRGLEVVDQSQFAELMEQVEKLDEGLIDPATGQQLGRMAGTEVLIFGTVMVSENSVKLDVRSIDLQTAKMIATGSTSLVRMGLLDRLASEAEGEDSQTASADEEGSVAQPASKSPAVKAPPRSKRDLGVLFALDGCSLNGDELTCSVTVTSDRDRWFALALESRAWNPSGDEFGAREVTIANSRDDRWCARKQILKNVATQLSLTFPQFGDEAAGVERIRIAWKEDENDCYNPLRSVDFEKIALSEDADFSSPQTAGYLGGKGNSTGGTGKKKSGGFLRVLRDKLEETAIRVIDKETGEILGEDEETKPPHR